MVGAGEGLGDTELLAAALDDERPRRLQVLPLPARQQAVPQLMLLAAAPAEQVVGGRDRHRVIGAAANRADGGQLEAHGLARLPQRGREADRAVGVLEGAPRPHPPLARERQRVRVACRHRRDAFVAERAGAHADGQVLCPGAPQSRVVVAAPGPHLPGLADRRGVHPASGNPHNAQAGEELKLFRTMKLQLVLSMA
eukprot:519536-Prymnesium_polylepis.1